MQTRISSRAAGIRPSATLAVDARQKELRAQGRPVIGFAAGEPDFATPPHVVEAARVACGSLGMHKYTPAAGLPALREAIADKTRRDSGLAVEPRQVVVTNGGKHAIFSAFATLCDPGDEVLVPAPYWTTYPEAIRLAGGVPVPVVTDEESGYVVRIDQLERALTDRTKVVLLVSPSNPTGAVYGPDEVRAIGSWALERGLWVMTDEIYEHLVYGDAVFTSVLAAVPDIAERCVVVNGVAKAYAMTGWRVGWLVAPPDVATAATDLQSHMTSNVSNVAQAAALAALQGDQSVVAEMRAAFDRRRRLMLRLLTSMPGVVCPEPLGAFYCYPAVGALLGVPLRGRSARTSAQLAELLLAECEIAVVPGEAFGTGGYLRLSYALGEDDIVEGLGRLGHLLAESELKPATEE
jgi:aspartate aminotransferase